MLTRPSITKFLVRAALISTLFSLLAAPTATRRTARPPQLTTTSAAVPDYGNNRVLIYSVPLGGAFDQTASTVVGQAGFTTAAVGTTASTMNRPRRWPWMPRAISM